MTVTKQKRRARGTMQSDGDRMIRAAGEVLWRSSASGAVEVALVHRPEYDDWSLPKGKPTREVDHLAWVPLADARRLDYQGDAYAIDALRSLADSVRSGSAVLLVRNARAVPAGRWHDAGGYRLLDVKGRGQAENLRRTLPAFAPSRLLSASEARFVDTMRPLSAELGVAVEIELTFGEDEYAARPRHGLTRILELADGGSTSAVCAPGAVIRHLLATLAEDAGLDVREYPAVKGSVWALFFSGGRLAAADYYPALTSPRP
jgi:8-oxo-(d)GTP phosphatase